MAGKEIQNSVFARLRRALPDNEVVKEWSVRRQARDAFNDPLTYAPRLDVAVGPFNSTFQNRFEDAELIRRCDNRLVRNLCDVIQRQNAEIRLNPNPRCLVAIEVEHSTSSKHILGAITNASLLGLYGIVIGSPEYLTKVRRIHTYVQKVRELGKAPLNMLGNVACLGQREFLRLLN